MSDAENKPSAGLGLEGLLRRWGAETAMGKVQVPQPPSVQAGPGEGPAAAAAEEQGGEGPFAEPPAEPTQEPWPAPAWMGRLAGPKAAGLMVRWLPVGAAAAVLLCSLVLFLQVMYGSGGPGRLRRELDEVTAERNRLQKENAEAVEGYEFAKAQLSQQAGAVQKVRAKHQAERTALAHTLEQKDAQMARLKEKLAKSMKLLEQMGPDLEVKTAQVKEAEKLLAYKDQQLDEQVRDVDERRRRLAAAQQELDRLIRINEDAARASRRVLSDMARIRAQREGLFGDARRLYLSAVAAGQFDLQASQTAARQEQMLPQCQKLRALADADTLRALIEKLEVFFTRLEMLNVASPDEAQSFQAAVNRSRIISQIDEALGSALETPPLRTWLFKSRLILMGEAHVG